MTMSIVHTKLNQCSVLMNVFSPAAYTEAVVSVFVYIETVPAFSASSSATVFGFTGASWGIFFGVGAGKITLPS